MSFTICFNLDQSKILSSGNGLSGSDHEEKKKLSKINGRKKSWWKIMGKGESNGHQYFAPFSVIV